MKQPTPNHRPPGSAAPRLVDDLRDDEVLSRVERRTLKEPADAEFERDVHLSRARVEEWAAKERDRQCTALIELIKFMPLAIIAALALTVAVYAIAKTQAGAGL